MGFLSSLFGVSDRTPKTSNVVTSTKLPTELAPYVTDVLGEAQDLYKAEVERGYDPYTGQTIAPLSAEEQQAMTGITGLTGTTTPYIQEALGTYRKGGDEFTAETAEKFMSPYQQAVTDVQLREAQENFEGKVMPKFEANAISQGGGMSGLGTRAGIQAAELQRGQSQLLADIQAKGSQAAFQDARQGFEAQQARERQMAGDIGRTGPALFQAGLAEAGALQTVGQQKRELGQSVLNEAYGKFLQEQNFPKQQIADYSSTIYGAAPSFTTGAGSRATSGLPGAPSMGQQLLGMGLTGLNMYGAGTAGGQNFSLGNMASTMYGRKNSAAGGQVGGGLSTIHRATGGGLDGTDASAMLQEYYNINPNTGEEEEDEDFSFLKGAKEAAPLYRDAAIKNIDETRGVLTGLVNERSDLMKKQQSDKEALSTGSFSKREAEIERRSKKYPFAAIQKGISKSLLQPTIAMMFTEGVAVTAGEMEAKADELDTLTDALEKEKFGAKSKEMAAVHEANLARLKSDAEIQIKMLGLDKSTQLEILKAMLSGVKIETLLENALAAKAKAKTGSAAKLTEPVRKTIELSSAQALGFTAKYDDQGNLLKISGDKELNPTQAAALNKYELDFLYAFGQLRDQKVSEPTALARASKYAEQQSKGQPAAQATPAVVGKAPRVSVAPSNLPRPQLGGTTGLLTRPTTP